MSLGPEQIAEIIRSEFNWRKNGGLVTIESLAADEHPHNPESPDFWLGYRLASTDEADVLDGWWDGFAMYVSMFGLPSEIVGKEDEVVRAWAQLAADFSDGGIVVSRRLRRDQTVWGRVTVEATGQVLLRYASLLGWVGADKEVTRSAPAQQELTIELRSRR